MRFNFRPLLFIAVMMTAGQVMAQEVDVQETDLFTLSLEELMNVPINSASKKDETLFDAPLSSYTITRADIDKAGSNSIMEALRLAPGVIVREQTNGAYDIHIRGFDNVMAYSETYTKTNTTVLVMIDNRPVFNHNLGGTFWEALPIDINDVERIEIVRGPSAPLFGPNAVTGVINIITRRVAADKTSVNATVQYGTQAATLANVSAGKSFGKFSLQVSGNYQKRDRFEDNYYLPDAAAYFTIDQLATMVPAGNGMYQQYPDPSLAMEKFGVNAFLTYNVSDKINFDLSVGTQASEVQKVFLANIFNGALPITVNQSETSYFNLSGKIHGLNFRASYLPGSDNLALESSPNQYDYNIYDATAEYTIHLGKVGTLVPGVSYQEAVYGDEAYANEGLTFLGGTSADMTTTSGFVRTDLKPIKNFRVIAAVRVDKFTAPDDAYLAYEFATTYKVNDAHLVRAAITRSNSGSFIANNYLNFTVPNFMGTGMNYSRVGNENLKLFTVNMVEIGYRAQITKSFQLDIDVFQQKAEDFATLLTMNGVVLGPGVFMPTLDQFQNIPTSATQKGATLSLNFVPNDKIQFKPFVTVQKTETENLPSSFLDPALATALGAPVEYQDYEHKNTPSVYGGYYLNYKVTKSFNVNLNGYYFGSHRQYDQHDLANTGETGDIAGKFLFNAKASYAIGKFNVYVNGRNVFNNNSREFFGTDKIGAVYSAGVSVNLN